VHDDRSSLLEKQMGITVSFPCATAATSGVAPFTSWFPVMDVKVDEGLR
jgi:hypothetical protein